MPIYQEDLKIYKSQDMTDEPWGGGRTSFEEISTGISNEVFDDVSDLNAITGNVSIRKLFFSPATDNTDKLMASRVVFTDLPDNKNVSVFAFEPVHENDRRKEAKDKMEEYLAYGGKWAGHLLEDQLKGQKVIELSLDKEDRVPSVDDVIVLVQNALDEDKFDQYLKITKVTTETRRFPIAQGKTVERKVATLEISQPLRFTFNGFTVKEYMDGRSDKRKAVVRDSRVADASKYYSAVLLSSEANKDDRQLQLESVYVQVVPSTQTTTPLPRLNPANTSKFLIRGSTDTVKVNHALVVINTTTIFSVGSAVYPNTLSLTIGYEILKDKNGEVVDEQGQAWGSINYETGSIRWYSENNSSGITAEYIPAVKTSRVNRTVSEQVPEDAAGLSYLRTLPETPASGTLTISYQVDGNVYTLVDRGSGELISLDGTGGVGSITDRTVKWTAGAIPDSGSIIVYSYGEDSNAYTYKNIEVKFAVTIPLPGTSSIVKEGLEISWDSQQAVSDNVGVLSGDAGGQVYPDKIVLYFDQLPANGTDFTIDYKRGSVAKVENNAVSKTDIADGVEIIISGNTPIAQGSFHCNVELPNGVVSLRDDGKGNVFFSQGFSLASGSASISTANTEGDVIGTIDYENRKVTLKKIGIEKVYYRERYSQSLGAA